MTKLEVIKGICNAICSSFYPDENTIKVIMYERGMMGCSTAEPHDTACVELAIELVGGFVSTKIDEGGVSVESDMDAINANIRKWCSKYDLDYSKYVKNPTIVSNASNRW